MRWMLQQLHAAAGCSSAWQPEPPGVVCWIRYILGPILAVLAIAAFFGALLYLQLEKATDIKRGMAGGSKQEGVVKPDPNRRTWHSCCLPSGRGRRGQATNNEGSQMVDRGNETSAPPAAVGAAAADKGGVATTPRGLRGALPRVNVPKLAIPSFKRRPSEGAAPTPRDTARSLSSAPRTPRSPGVLYVEHP